MRILVLLMLLMGLGCAGGGTAGVSEEAKENQSMEVAKKYGDRLVAADLDGAYAMTTSRYQGEVSREEFQKKFEKATQEYGNTVEVRTTDIGSLPSSEEEARSDYEINTTIPMDKWHGWAMVSFNTPKGGMDVRMLVVQDSGGLKIDHVEYTYPD